MKILFDTNVILDVLLDRSPFSDPASQLFSLVERGDLSGIICATSVTTVHYLSTKALGEAASSTIIRNLITIFEIAAVNRTVIENALDSGFSDFEDSVVHQSAIHAKAECLVTRDRKGFKNAVLPVFDPIEMINILMVH